MSDRDNLTQERVNFRPGDCIVQCGAYGYPLYKHLSEIDDLVNSMPLWIPPREMATVLAITHSESLIMPRPVMLLMLSDPEGRPVMGWTLATSKSYRMLHDVNDERNV